MFGISQQAVPTFWGLNLTFDHSSPPDHPVTIKLNPTFQSGRFTTTTLDIATTQPCFQSLLLLIQDNFRLWWWISILNLEVKGLAVFWSAGLAEGTCPCLCPCPCPCPCLFYNVIDPPDLPEGTCKGSRQISSDQGMWTMVSAAQTLTWKMRINQARQSQIFFVNIKEKILPVHAEIFLAICFQKCVVGGHQPASALFM